MRTQQIIETVYCDPCRVDGKETVATDTFTVAINAGTRLRVEPRIVDVCESHAKEYRALLNAMKMGARETIAGNGDKPKPPSSGTTDCPWCGKIMVRGSIGVHAQDIHGAVRIVQPKQCPDCSVNQPYAPSMVLHRSYQHGYDLMAEYRKMADKEKKKPSRSKG